MKVGWRLSGHTEKSKAQFRHGTRAARVISPIAVFLAHRLSSTGGAIKSHKCTHTHSALLPPTSVPFSPMLSVCTPHWEISLVAPCLMSCMQGREHFPMYIHSAKVKPILIWINMNKWWNQLCKCLGWTSVSVDSVSMSISMFIQKLMALGKKLLSSLCVQERKLWYCLPEGNGVKRLKDGC